MNVAIAGCGWLGCALARRLLDAGERVVGIRRSPAAAARLEALGVVPAIGDLTRDAATLVPEDADVVVACQSADAGDAASYRAAYVDATAALLDLAARRSLRRLVVVSSTGVFGYDDGRVVDESTPTAADTATGAILVEAERGVLDAAAGGVAACIVRPSGLYGPGRFGVIDRVRRGVLALGPGDDRFMNFCHRDDAVAVVAAAIERGRAGGVYHATDARPPRRADVVRFVAGRLGIDPPRAGRTPGGPGGRRGANRRVSGDATRAELGVALAYPGFADGLDAAPSSVWRGDGGPPPPVSSG